MTEKELKKLLDQVEKKYLNCWKILSSLKTKPDRSIILFQGILCEALLNLSNGYRVINQVRQDLIQRKLHLSKDWFSKRQRVLARRQKEIVEAIGIGKVLGDAFVWFFFHNDRDLLEKHSKHQQTVHMPPGYGGIGEMTLMKNIKMLGEYLVIYHGMTTILRIGDISFIDLKKFKVAGIGEIKTSPIDKNELSISILMNFTKKSLPVKLPKSKGAKKNRNAIDKLPQKMKDRLKRQMVKINNSLLSGKEDKYKTQLNRSLDFYYKEFEDLLSKCKAYKFSYAQFGKGFLCAVYRQRKRSLYAIVSSKSQSDINKRLNGIIPRTKSLLVKGSEFNHIKLGFLMYTEKGIPWLMPGAIPVFWWPIKIEMIRKIIFHECLIVTVYNPVNLIESLKREGYRIIKIEGKKLDFKIEKEINDKKMVFGNLWFFFDLITQCFVRESEILSLIRDTENKIQRIGKDHESIKAELRIFQMLGRPF